MLFSPTPFARPAKPSTPNDERSATSRRPLPTATSAAPSDSWSEVPSERSNGSRRRRGPVGSFGRPDKLVRMARKVRRRASRRRGPEADRRRPVAAARRRTVRGRLMVAPRPRDGSLQTDYSMVAPRPQTERAVPPGPRTIVRGRVAAAAAARLRDGWSRGRETESRIVRETRPRAGPDARLVAALPDKSRHRAVPAAAPNSPVSDDPSPRNIRVVAAVAPHLHGLSAS